MTGATRPSAAGRTDIGRMRTGNEDSLLVEPPLYAVADGLGGHRAGEVASGIALDTLLAEAPKRADSKSLGRAVRGANRAVIDAAVAGSGRAGMGTTLTAVMVDGPHLAFAHVGDSRAYLLRQGRLSQLTQDHSMVADMVRAGQLTAEEARFHPQRSVITRALGSDPAMVVDTFDHEAEPGDRLLLCTDGLTTMVDDTVIERLLAEASGPQAAVEVLVDEANRAGGHDNITAVVIDIGDVPASAMAPAAGSGEARRRVAARLLWAVAALALVGAAAWGAYSLAHARAYLVAKDGQVVVYRGVPGEFAGVRLSWEVQRTGIAVSSLDPVRARRLEAGLLRFSSLEKALAAVEGMRSVPQSSTPATGTPPAGP